MNNNDISFEEFLKGLSGLAQSELTEEQKLAKKADEQRKSMNDTLDSLKELAELFQSIGKMAEFLNDYEEDNDEDKVDLSYLFEEELQGTLFDEEAIDTKPLTREEHVHQAELAYYDLKALIHEEMDCELVTGYAGAPQTSTSLGQPVILQPMFANLIDNETKELVASTMIMEDSSMVGVHNFQVAQLYVALHLVIELEELDFLEPEWDSFYNAPRPIVSTIKMFNRTDDTWDDEDLSKLPLHVYDDSFIY